MGKYKYIKMIILILGIIGMIGGTLVSAMTVRGDSEAIDFIIDAETVRKYGHFNDITTEATVTGTILKPIDDLDENEKRPCVFLFHGMFLNRFMQLQTG